MTALMLLFASASVSVNEFIEKPIDCIIMGFEKEQQKPVETFCWVFSTFTVVPTEDNRQQEKVYQTYYQWVPFVLFFQAILFYLPKWLWKQGPGDLMLYLRGADAETLTKTEERKKKSDELANYFAERIKVRYVFVIPTSCFR